MEKIKKEDFDFFEENGVIVKRPKVDVDPPGSVVTYRQIQENKFRIRMREEAKQRAVFDPEKDLKDMMSR